MLSGGVPVAVMRTHYRRCTLLVMTQFPPGGSGGASQDNKRVLCGVLAILLGYLGIHRFILGDVGGGILRIVITLVTCGAGHVIGLIEGIIYLTKSDAEFYQTYQVEKKAWF